LVELLLPIYPQKDIYDPGLHGAVPRGAIPKNKTTSSKPAKIHSECDKIGSYSGRWYAIDSMVATLGSGNAETGVSVTEGKEDRRER
jgi:hypothetical protein